MHSTNFTSKVDDPQADKKDKSKFAGMKKKWENHKLHTEFRSNI